MLKRTLVATALVASFGANAATSLLLTASPNGTTPANTDFTAGASIDYSIEGSTSVTSFLAPDHAVRLAAAYQAGDTVTFTYNADIESVGSLKVFADADAVAASSNVAPLTSTATNFMALGFLSKDANSVTYRVTEVKGDTTALTLVVDGLTFKDESVEALGSKVSMSYSASTSTGVAIDVSATGNKIADLLELKNQYAVKTTNADGEIDVATLRLKFTGGATSDTLAIDVTETSGLGYAATASKAVYTLNGDFSWIVDQNTTTPGIQSNVVSEDGPNTVVTSIAADKIVFTTTATSPEDFTITFDTSTNAVNTTGPNATALPATTYTVDSVLTYEDTGTDGAGTAKKTNLTETTAAIPSGAWTLNGATAKVRAYPVSSNIENFLWVTNDGSLSGAISVVATANGQTYDLGMVGTAAPKTLTYIANEVNAALAAEGISSGRVQLDITVNAPSTSVDVYAGYKVVSDADRLTLTVE